MVAGVDKKHWAGICFKLFEPFEVVGKMAGKEVREVQTVHTLCFSGHTNNTPPSPRGVLESFSFRRGFGLHSF